MINKSYFWILIAVVTLALAGWQFWGCSLAGADHPIQKSAKRQPAAISPIQVGTAADLEIKLEEKEKSRLDVEGQKLVKDARKALEAGDKEGFEDWIIEIIHRYKGDPNPLLLEFADVLKHSDPHLRIRIAGYFLLANLKAKEAVNTLRELVRFDRPLSYGPEKNDFLNEDLPPSDFRFRAADMLAMYSIEAARNDVWNLYKQTRSKELVKPLRRLNDPNMIEELRENAVKNLGTIENMRLIGEYRFAEALPELKKRYEDKALNPDVRFRTLYPLWRLTGDEKYFDEFSASFLPANIPLPYLVIGGEREHNYLIEMMKTATSDQLYEAAIALYFRFKDHETIKKTIMDYYRDVRGSNWKDMALARRFVGSIADAELTRMAEEYEAKYPTGNYNRDAVYRREWSYAREAGSLFMD
jgi:hypothetical protein